MYDDCFDWRSWFTELFTVLHLSSCLSCRVASSTRHPVMLTKTWGSRPRPIPRPRTWVLRPKTWVARPRTWILALSIKAKAKDQYHWRHVAVVSNRRPPINLSDHRASLLSEDAAAGSKFWNSLPDGITVAPSLPKFGRKKHLFRQSYPNIIM